MTQQSNTEAVNKFNYDPKYEGIQEGIEVFGDMSLKQINFIAKMLKDIPTVRGCFNVCSHCFVHAKPPISEKEGYINRMAFEDFKAFCEGFNELNRRLGFNIFDADNKHRGYNSLFYDSDGSNVYLKDENDNEHDYIELAEMLYKTTNKKVIFDTAGWNPKDKATQARMEKYVQHYRGITNPYIYLFDFSVNPFHSIYTALVKALKEGNVEKAENYKNIYIDRQVNALFTITPMITKPYFSYIVRAMKDGTKGGEGFTAKDCFLLYIDIIKKLEEKYNEDLNSPEPKHIHSKEQIKGILDKLYSQLRTTINAITFPTGKIMELYEKDDPILKVSINYQKNILKHLENMSSSTSDIYGVLDINGQFYVRSSPRYIRTDLAFNFKNKNKKTALIGLGSDFILTNDLLDDII